MQDVACGCVVGICVVVIAVVNVVHTCADIRGYGVGDDVNAGVGYVVNSCDMSVVEYGVRVVSIINANVSVAVVLLMYLSLVLTVCTWLII